MLLFITLTTVSSFCCLGVLETMHHRPVVSQTSPLYSTLQTLPIYLDCELANSKVAPWSRSALTTVNVTGHYRGDALGSVDIVI